MSKDVLRFPWGLYSKKEKKKMYKQKNVRRKGAGGRWSSWRGGGQAGKGVEVEPGEGGGE